MDFSGPVTDDVAIGRFNPNIFHKIDTWNFAPNDVNDSFLIKEWTPVVIAPGSEMPYCLVHWVGNIPTDGDGWPVQAANPGAYVSLLKSFAPAPDDVAWQPILLSHKPTWLRPGYYCPALPQMAFCGSQWDHEHAWADGLDDPEVLLMTSDSPVEMSHYQFTTEEYVNGTGARTTKFPWLITPIAAGLVASFTNLVWSKALGYGGSNKTGTAQAASFDLTLFTVSRTYPDIVANYKYQDYGNIAEQGNDTRTNVALERFGWFKLQMVIDAGGGTPAGVGYVIT